MSERPVRIGIIGTGVGLRTMLPAFAETPAAEVVALVGSNESRAREFANAHGIDQSFGSDQEMYRAVDLDLVCIATPTGNHFEGISEALCQEVAVLAEKPLAMTVDEAQLLARDADERKVLAVVDHQLRFNPYIRRVAELIGDGALGDVYLIRVHQQSQAFTDPTSPWTWSFEPSKGGGLRFAMGPHLVDLVMHWLPDHPVEVVSCALHPAVAERTGPDGETRKVATSGSISAQLRFVDGVSAMLTSSAAAHSPPRFDFDVYGSDGELHFSLEDKLTGALRKPTDGALDVDGVQEAERRNEVSIFKGSFAYLAPQLVNAVRSGDSELPHAATFRDGVKTQAVLEAMLDSASRGESVELGRGLAGRESF